MRIWAFELAEGQQRFYTTVFPSCGHCDCTDLSSISVPFLP